MPNPKDPLTKILELCQAQQRIVQTTGERLCKDEFVALMAVIERWANEAKQVKLN